MSYPVSKGVLDQVFERLSAEDADGVGGFNTVFNSLASGYELTGPRAAMAITFVPATGKRSPNFFRGNLSGDDIIASTTIKFPFITMFPISSVNENLQKFHQFSGTVAMGMNIFLSWKEDDANGVDFNAYAMCVEETMYTVFNRCRNASPGDQDWTDSITYNGDLTCQLGRVIRGEEFWGIQLGFTATFEVDQRGEV